MRALLRWGGGGLGRCVARAFSSGAQAAGAPREEEAEAVGGESGEFEKAPTRHGIKYHLQRQIEEFEGKTGLLFSELSNNALDELIRTKRHELVQKGVALELDAEKIAYTMRFLGHFSKDMKFWFKKDKADFLTFMILYLNLEHLPHVQLHKDYRSCRDKKSKITLKTQIDSAIYYNSMQVFLNSCWTPNLLDVAIIRNCYRAREFTEVWNKGSIQFGIASDLFDFVFTAYDSKNGVYRISKPYQIFTFSKKQFNQEQIERFLLDLKVLLFSFKYDTTVL